MLLDATPSQQFCLTVYISFMLGSTFTFVLKPHHFSCFGNTDNIKFTVFVFDHLQTIKNADLLVCASGYH